MLGSNFENLEPEGTLPVYMISVRENMYQKVTRMLKFICGYCEEQEHELQELSVVCINLTEKSEEKEGEIQIDVDGSWLKKFKIRTFIVEILKQEKLSFNINYGNADTESYFLYTITYNDEIRRTESELILQETPILEKRYYLRITIKTTISLVKSIFPKLRTYLRIIASKFPSVEIQFNASGSNLNEEVSDDKYMKMIAESVGEVLKYGLNFEFRKTIFEMFNVNSKEWAVDELYNHLCHCIPDKD